VRKKIKFPPCGNNALVIITIIIITTTIGKMHYEKRGGPTGRKVKERKKGKEKNEKLLVRVLVLLL
jgi:hypothetical protein